MMKSMVMLVLLVLLTRLFEFANSSADCPNCDLVQDRKDVRLETIKFQILSTLGLSSPPNMSKHYLPEIPPLKQWLASKSFNLHSGRNHAKDETDDDRARIEKVLSFAEPVPGHVRGERPKCCHYTFSPKTTRMKVARARQWVYIKRTGNATRNQNTAGKINLYKYTFPFRHSSPNRTLVASRNIILTEGWQHFKVKRVVSEWFDDPHTNIGLDVEIVNPNVTIVQPGESVSFQPFIEVYTKDRVDKRRVRRGTRICEKASDNQQKCCLHNLTVDFESFNWDWIIAPKRFVANVCIGHCPRLSRQSRLHTQLAARASKSYTPCCSPSNMSSISVLYFDNDTNVVYEVIPGMIANSCGCS